jgi:prepilin-type N-terminal cleavage/methylation domain-containing protein
MVDQADCSLGTAVVRVAKFALRRATSVPLRVLCAEGFTLIEVLVSVTVLVLLVTLASQLLNSAATITALGHKRMDTDSQARQVLDRMAVDFAQMVKRPDVDYYIKSSATPPPVGVRLLPQAGNDSIAFYSTVPGYYPSTGSQSPVSLVVYRVNAQNKLERMGKGLVWNAISATDTPVVFVPIPLTSPIPLAELPSPTPNPTPTPAWPTASNLAASPTPEPSVEVFGTQVFRFEYYYLLKGQTVNGTTYAPILTSIPWDTRISSASNPSDPHTGVAGMRDVAAVVVDIAVVDSKTKVLLTDAQIATLAGSLADYSGQGPGVLLSNWRSAVDGNTSLPRAALSGIRLYERYLYLSPPTQGTL